MYGYIYMSTLQREVPNLDRGARGEGRATMPRNDIFKSKTFAFDRAKHPPPQLSACPEGLNANQVHMFVYQ